jgi:hypothetical protein
MRTIPATPVIKVGDREAQRVVYKKSTRWKLFQDIIKREIKEIKYGQSFDMTPRSCNVALNVFIGAIVSDVNQSIKRMIKVTQSITLIDLVYS